MAKTNGVWIRWIVSIILGAIAIGGTLLAIGGWKTSIATGVTHNTKSIEELDVRGTLPAIKSKEDIIGIEKDITHIREGIGRIETVQQKILDKLE